MIINNQTFINPSDILEQLANYFFTEPRDTLSHSQQEIQDNNPNPRKPFTTTEFTRRDDRDSIPPILEEELATSIFSFQITKAPGPDGIQAFILQDMSRTLKSYLLLLFNSCLSLQYFPTYWKIATVSTVPKPGKDNYFHPSSYRPISLLSIIGKAFEKIINARLRWYGAKHQWFSPSQHGFLESKSTITAIGSLISTVEEGFRIKQSTLASLLDISGAFDNAWHPSILNGLINRKCPAYLIKIISNFLQDRKVVLSFQSTTLTKSTGKGTPQESVLSPFL